MDCDKKEEGLKKQYRMLGNGFLSYAVLGKRAPQHELRSVDMNADYVI